MHASSGTADMVVSRPTESLRRPSSCPISVRPVWRSTCIFATADASVRSCPANLSSDSLYQHTVALSTQ